MKVFLTTLNSKFIHSNLAIRYLSAYCRDLPVEMEICEFNINQNLDYILAQIYKAQPDVVGFSCYIWNIVPTLQLCSNLRKVLPNLKIVLGGPEVSFDSAEILRRHNFIDYIVRGEGEVTFYELLQKLISPKVLEELPDISMDEIAGLTFWQNGAVISAPDRPLLTNLDEIPSPYATGLSDYENRLVYYESSRGCPFNCQYCLSSTQKGVRTFSMPRIYEDLTTLINARVKMVKFVDRTFNFDPVHAVQIMRFLLENQRQTTFHFEITAHLVTEEMLELLKAAPVGLFQFEIGVQTTFAPTLRAIRRAEDFARLTEVVRVVSSYQNVHLHLDLIAGLPEEDYTHFRQSFNDVFNLKPDNLQLGFLKMLKGSGIRNDAEKYAYQYTEEPPYEVLSNRFISYSEILDLKMIEDLLETYYNSHKFDFSVDFIITRFYFAKPFDFFNNLKDYWETHDYHHRPHKDVALYEILFHFYQDKLGEELDIFQEYLKLDFLRTIRTVLLPEWLNHVEVPDYKARVFKFINDHENIQRYLPGVQGLDSRQILRRILVEPFKFDLLHYKERGYQGKLDSNETLYVLFDYEERDPIFNRVKYTPIQL